MELIYRKNLIIQCLKCMRSGNCYHYNVFFDIGENYFIPIYFVKKVAHVKWIVYVCKNVVFNILYY